MSDEITLDERFLKIPIYVVVDPRISFKAKLIYGLLYARAFNTTKPKQCFPAQETIAANLAVSVAAVKSSLDELVKFGYIEKKQKLRNQGRHNVYTIFEPEDIHGDIFCKKRRWDEYDFVTIRASQITKSVKPFIDLLVRRTKSENASENTSPINTERRCGVE